MSISNNDDLLSELLWSNIKTVVDENIKNIKDLNSTEEYHTLFNVLNKFYKILIDIQSDKNLMLCLSNEGKNLVRELFLAIEQSQSLIIVNYKDFTLDMCSYMEELSDSFILYLDKKDKISIIQNQIYDAISLIELTINRINLISNSKYKVHHYSSSIHKCLISFSYMKNITFLALPFFLQVLYKD